MHSSRSQDKPRSRSFFAFIPFIFYYSSTNNKKDKCKKLKQQLDDCMKLNHKSMCEVSISEFKKNCR